MSTSLHLGAGRTPSAKAAAAAEARTPVTTGRSTGGRKASKGVGAATTAVIKGGRTSSPRGPTTTSRKGRNIKARACIEPAIRVQGFRIGKTPSLRLLDALLMSKVSWVTQC